MTASPSITHGSKLFFQLPIRAVDFPLWHWACGFNNPPEDREPCNKSEIHRLESEYSSGVS